MKYFIGIDNGGTTTKAAVFDQYGHELAVCSTQTKTIVSQPGFVEIDMEQMWHANCQVIKQALITSGIQSTDIAAVSLCGHGKGLYLWGKNNRPIRNAILSTDSRSTNYITQWRSNHVEKKLYQLTNQHILASQPIALLAWLNDNEPSALTDSQWIFECKDYIRFCLTDRAFAEITDYSGTNLVNLHTGKYDLNILELVGLEECYDKLPPLCKSTDICGTITESAAALTGLLCGTPVVAGAFDIDACAVGVNAISDQHIFMIAGTWSINGYINQSPVTHQEILMNSFFCDGQKYLIEESSPTSAGNLEWFIHQFLESGTTNHSSIYQMLNRWVEQVGLESDTPVFLPFLLGNNTSDNTMAAFVGFNQYHTKKHLVTAIYEGVVFSHKFHFDKLMAVKQTPTKAIRLAGGAAKSYIWSKMFADVLNLPVERVDANEPGALGCAVISSVAVGDYDSLSSAANKMCQIKEPILPDPKKHIQYLDKYQKYINVISQLKN